MPAVRIDAKNWGWRGAARTWDDFRSFGQEVNGALSPQIPVDAAVIPTWTIQSSEPQEDTAMTYQQNFNFQLGGAPVPDGYVEEDGSAYAVDPGWGWVLQGTTTPQDSTGEARDRNRGGIPQELDTLIHMHRYSASPFVPVAPAIAWQIDVDNGTYSVTVSVGDQPDGGFGYNSVHRININGVNVIDDFVGTAGQEYMQAIAIVNVTTGRITIDSIGGANTKINYVQIVQQIVETYTPFANDSTINAAAWNQRTQEIDDAIENVKEGNTVLSAPRIGSFANAEHDHTDAAGGGRLTVDAFDTGSAPAGAVNVAGTGLEVRGSVPIGACFPYPAASAPTGWLLCTGQAVSRATYAALFVAIGTTYGVGDGSTTFNLPDMRGRLVGGLDNLGGIAANRVTDEDADTLGGAVGAEDHQLTVAEMPAHTHLLDVTVGGTTPSTISGGSTIALGSNPDTQSTGGDVAHNNVQPSLFTNWIIRT
jgi:microcystin-dependent protein